MNALLRTVATAPFRLLPSSVRRRVVQAALHAAASQPARDALRELMTLESDLSGLIDEAALEYDGGVHAKHRLMRYHDFFVDRLKTGERVLDIGCGYGAVAFSMASRAGAIVTGLDMDPANIANAKNRFSHENLTFVVGQAPRDVPSEPFGAVVMSNVLEHIEHRIRFINEVQARVTAERWLIRVPMFNRDWRPPLRQEIGLFPYGDPTHFTEYTRESFEQEMADTGFEVRHLQVNWGEVWAEVGPRP